MHSFQTDEVFSFDAGGNRTNTGYTTGADNQLTNDGTFSYTYDDEGNRLTRTNDTTFDVTEYQWDYRNRLTQVTEKDGLGAVTKVVAYTYDVFNRRIAKAVDTTSPFTLTDAAIERYILDDASGIASATGGNVVLDFVDPDGDGAATLDLKRRYLYGEAVDQILAQEDITQLINSPSRVLFPLTDHLGTVRDLVRNDSSIATHFVYDSFGTILSGNTSLTRYLFTSREFDADTNLQTNRARYYDAATGRWLSHDPIGFAAGDTNIYRYVGNNVTNATDPSGLLEVITNGTGGRPATVAHPNGSVIVVGSDPRVTPSGMPYEATPNIAELALLNYELTGAPKYLKNPIFLYALKTVGYARLKQGLADPASATKAIYGAAATSAAIGVKVNTGLHGQMAPRQAFSPTRTATPTQAPREPVPKTGNPLPAKIFKPPTNPAQAPPTTAPTGHRIRKMPPTQQYPNGYWKLEKQLPDGNWQPIDPSTMKLGTRPETHVPLPSLKPPTNP